MEYRYRLYVIQHDEWGDEEERTIRSGTNREQMETLFDVWKDIIGPHAVRLVLEDTLDSYDLMTENFGRLSYYDD